MPLRPHPRPASRHPRTGSIDPCSSRRAALVPASPCPPQRHLAPVDRTLATPGAGHTSRPVRQPRHRLRITTRSLPPDRRPGQTHTATCTPITVMHSSMQQVRQRQPDPAEHQPQHVPDRRQRRDSRDRALLAFCRGPILFPCTEQGIAHFGQLPGASHSTSRPHLAVSDLVSEIGRIERPPRSLVCRHRCVVVRGVSATNALLGPHVPTAGVPMPHDPVQSPLATLETCFRLLCTQPGALTIDGHLLHPDRRTSRSHSTTSAAASRSSTPIAAWPSSPCWYDALEQAPPLGRSASLASCSRDSATSLPSRRMHIRPPEPKHVRSHGSARHSPRPLPRLIVGSAGSWTPPAPLRLRGRAVWAGGPRGMSRSVPTRLWARRALTVEKW